VIPQVVAGINLGLQLRDYVGIPDSYGADSGERKPTRYPGCTIVLGIVMARELGIEGDSSAIPQSLSSQKIMEVVTTQVFLGRVEHWFNSIFLRPEIGCGSGFSISGPWF